MRAEAAKLIVGWYGATGFDLAVSALFDPAKEVRVISAKAIGSLGEPVVPKLLSLAMQKKVEDAIGPVVALSAAGGPGRAALIKIATDHSDERVRRLARLVLGQDAGEEH